jgi:hypothetical protein
MKDIDGKAGFAVAIIGMAFLIVGLFVGLINFAGIVLHDIIRLFGGGQ